MNEASHISDFVAKVLERNNLTGVVEEARVKRAYREVVGDLISKLTDNLRYKDGCLSVKVLSSALRQELSYRQSGLIERMNDNIGRNVVKKIVFY